MKFKSEVTRVPAAPPELALRHFEARLGFETDCWDVHSSQANGCVDFVLLDVRSPELYAVGHVPGSTNLPTRMLSEESLASYPEDSLFVVYCAGPHCNGANKAAVRLARLGRPVKEMLGGITGWLDEGYALESSPAESSARSAAAVES